MNRPVQSHDANIPPTIRRVRKFAAAKEPRSGCKAVTRDLEFVLGSEAQERFVYQEPLRRVHECVFGVLAPESEPVDPRL